MNVSPDTPLVPTLVCSLGIGLLCIMDASMKLLTLGVGVYSAVLWRSMLSTLTAGAIWSAGDRRLPEPRILGLHILRAIIIGCILVSFFWGLARLPLAEGIALSFVAPLIALFLAAFLLGEKIRPQAIWASLAGLAGVGIVLVGQAGHGNYDPGALLGSAAVLASTFFYALNLILGRKQALVAKPVEIIFFQNLTLTVLFGLAAPWLGRAIPQDLWPALGAAVLLSLTGQALMVWAYSKAEAQYLIPTEYTAFIWSIVIGWLWFNEPVTKTTLLGGTLIIAGCVVAMRSRPRLAKAVGVVGSHPGEQ